MHNGAVGGFREIRRSLESRLSQTAYDAVQGSTDSEQVFGLAIDAHAVADDTEPLERLARAMERAIAQTEELRTGHDVDEPSLLNLCLTDGRRAVVSRFVSESSQPSNTLYVHQGKRYECDEGVCRMLPADQRDQAVIVCSEPLSADDGWRAIPDNHLVLVDSNLEVRMRPIRLH
jgi:predicted glutamine amidotransferase